MVEAALICLALNIYHEARSENMTGKYAVAHVVMNRVASSKFPDTVCAVVKQSNARGCQFSWWCDGKSDTPYNKDEWAMAQLIAEDVITGVSDDITHGAEFYHADYVSPYWAGLFTETVTIGSHIFYIEE